MEKELKSKAKKRVLIEGIMILLFGVLLLCIFSFKNVLTIVIFLPIVFASAIYVTKSLFCINNSHLTYGKIKKVEKSDSDESLVYQNFTVEYINADTNEINETIVYEQFGDNDKGQEKNIQEFFKQGYDKVGKKVPLLYVPKNPQRTFVYLEKAK